MGFGRHLSEYWIPLSHVSNVILFLYTYMDYLCFDQTSKYEIKLDKILYNVIECIFLPQCCLSHALILVSSFHHFWLNFTKLGNMLITESILFTWCKHWRQSARCYKSIERHLKFTYFLISKLSLNYSYLLWLTKIFHTPNLDLASF